MCISISVSLVIKFVFIKYGVNNPLFDHPSLLYSFVTINTLVLRFLKILFDTPSDIVEKLYNPITNPICHIHLIGEPVPGPSGPRLPLPDGTGVPGPSRPSFPANQPGLEPIKPR
jgi:hypothetical protein